MDTMTRGMETALRLAMSSDYAWVFRGRRFSVLSITFEIDRAKTIIIAAPRPVVVLDLVAYWPWVQRPRQAGLVNVLPLDWQRIDDDPTIDLAFPVILGEARDRVFAIDGWQRIGKAVSLGIGSLPAIVLTADETEWCRVR